MVCKYFLSVAYLFRLTDIFQRKNSCFVGLFCFVVVIVQLLSHAWLFATPWTAAHQAFLPWLSPRVYLNLCLLSQWCHPTISFSATPFSSCPQFFPASGSFPLSQFFTSGGQSTGASASVSVLPMNIQHWFPLALPGLISLQFKWLSKIFSSTTVQKHQFFFSAQPSSWSN